MARAGKVSSSGGCCGCGKYTYATLAVLSILMAYLAQRSMDQSNRVIDREFVRQVSEASVGLPTIEEKFANITLALRNEYGDHIRDCEFIFMSSAGWKASFCLLHSSLYEYVLFFGTAIETSGHSGRWMLDIQDTLIAGEFVQWHEYTVHSKHFVPGETIYHPPFDITHLWWPADTWMVEYGDGFLPSSLPIAIADSIFSTLDWWTVVKTASLYAGHLWNEIFVLGNF